MITSLIRIIPKTLKDILRKIYLSFKYRNAIFHYGATSSNTFFEGNNLLRSGVALINAQIGYGSYISEDSQLSNIKIGKFCCIGTNVKNNFGRHPSNTFVSIHPAFFSTAGQAGFTYVGTQKFAEHNYYDKEQTIINKIGNDVWIGSHVLLMDGIEIGDGAIVAAGAVVTKDVEPYSIVGGVPAKIIGKRFSEEQIEFLLKFKWWDKEPEWINKNSAYFTNISEFISILKT
jgi:acetyltransferase-like isoleucine patch superfamily enzyme